MPRLARTVFADIPHHITQRGNRRGDVFFDDEDRKNYLKWLGEYCKKWKVDILAYCLMTNHIHLILRPTTKDGLHRVLKPLHMRYAQRINKSKGWKGHLWQGRFFSSPLDNAYTWAALRYVERNPVRAKMVKKAEEYAWSSASAHCGLTENSLLSSLNCLGSVISTENWSEWISLPNNEREIQILRRNIEKGLPCGSDKFIEKLEVISDKVLKFRPQGRPKKG